jgi:hypothetical protein
MDDLSDKELLQAIIGTLYEYSITGTEIKVFISSMKTTSYRKYEKGYRLVICPYKEGYRGKQPDIPKMTLLFTDSVPFIGTRDMKAHEVMPIVHRILTGEEKDGATGDWLD